MEGGGLSQFLPPAVSVGVSVAGCPGSSSHLCCVPMGCPALGFGLGLAVESPGEDGGGGVELRAVC
jgi:hypothetical protein